MDTFILNIFNEQKRQLVIDELEYFMFEDGKNPLFIHSYENLIFIYSKVEQWNICTISMICRSVIKGDFFIIFNLDEYDALLPSNVWEKKKEATKYFLDKEMVLSKYKRHYKIKKIKNYTKESPTN